MSNFSDMVLVNFEPTVQSFKLEVKVTLRVLEYVGGL